MRQIAMRNKKIAIVIHSARSPIAIFNTILNTNQNRSDRFPSSYTRKYPQYTLIFGKSKYKSEKVRWKLFPIPPVSHNLRGKLYEKIVSRPPWRHTPIFSHKNRPELFETHGKPSRHPGFEQFQGKIVRKYWGSAECGPNRGLRRPGPAGKNRKNREFPAGL